MRIAVSEWGSMVESADQAAQRRVGHHFIPVVENLVERRLASDRADDGAENGSHPQQCGEAPAEADAAQGGENQQNDHSQGEASQDQGRSQFLR